LITNRKIKQVGKGSSFFSFINTFSHEEKEGKYISIAFHRLCTLMRKMDVGSVIIEDITPDDDIVQEECDALCKYYNKDIKIEINRFTFLLDNISSYEKIKDPDIIFLASAIIINFQTPDEEWRTYLYSAIVTIPKRYDIKEKKHTPLLNNYVHIFHTFTCEVTIDDRNVFQFQITGTFFCQQNSITSVCAHASLCMTINNMGAVIITPEDINKKIGINHIDNRLDEKAPGLNASQINKVLESYGLTFTWMDFFENPNVEYDEYIYRFLESRCPVILAFSTATMFHVVPVIGHTLNTDIWRPEAEFAYKRDLGRLNYKSSAAWVDHFIIHDDNFGMYFCLPVGALKRVTLPKYDSIFRTYQAVAIIPSSLKTPAWEAEWASLIVIRDKLKKISERSLPIDEWSIRVLKSESIYSPRPVIVRTLFLKKDDYKKSLNDKDFKGNRYSENEKKQLLKNLPDLFWMSEITIQDLYTANKTKIIDFFYTCDKAPNKKNTDIFERWIQIRCPYALIVNNKNGDEIVSKMSVESHYPLYRFENSEDVNDW
jgi:hypothetical protein